MQATETNHSPVCIAGMHRSGTSMVAHLLHLGGLCLGEDADMWGPSADNPEGHWENVRLTRINDALLNALGGGWDCPPVWPECPAGDPRFAGLVTEARTVQQQCFVRAPWGWKDPRNSLTLPFWQDLWPSLKTIICLRNPLEVAVSLRRRGLSSYAFGLNLWRTYNTLLLEASSPQTRLITHYEAYFSDPRAEIGRLLEFTGLPVTEVVLEQCCAAVKGQHHRNRFTTQDLVEAGVCPEVLQLYSDLCAEAGWASATALGKHGKLSTRSADGTREQRIGLGFCRPADSSPLPPVEAGLLELEVARRDLETLGSKLGETADRAERARQEISERDARLGQLQQQLAQATEGAERARQAIAERDVRLGQFQQQLAQATEGAERAKQEISERDARLGQLQQQLAQVTDGAERAKREIAERARQEFAERDKTLASLRAQFTELRAASDKQGRQLEVIADAMHGAAQRQKDEDYGKLVQRVRRRVGQTVPPKATVMVLSKGDPDLLQFKGRIGWHFPQLQDGTYAGHYPADSQEAIRHLEALRCQRGQFLVVPSPARWWLDHYGDFRRHLEEHYAVAADVTQTCLIFDLRTPKNHAKTT